MMALLSLNIWRLYRTTISSSSNRIPSLLDRGGSSEEIISGLAALAEVSSNQIVVPGSAVDTVLPMGSGIVTGRMLLVESDADVTIKIGGTDVEREWPLRVPSLTTTSGLKARLIADVEFTSLYISVPGTVDANVYYAVVGV